MEKTKKIRPQDLVHHNTKRHVSIKFITLLLLLITYFTWLSWHYGIATGGLVSAITWSFFVLCTPIADAGFLIDFPLRLIFRVRMWVCELFVWITAIGIATWSTLANPEIFETTELTSLFFKILTHPWPFWLIVFLSASGTFLSVKFGDELLDSIEHRDRKFHHKHQLLFHFIVIAGFFLLILWGYYNLIEKLNIVIPH